MSTPGLTKQIKLNAEQKRELEAFKEEARYIVWVYEVGIKPEQRRPANQTPQARSVCFDLFKRLTEKGREFDQRVYGEPQQRAYRVISRAWQQACERNRQIHRERELILRLDRLICGALYEDDKFKQTQMLRVAAQHAGTYEKLGYKDAGR